jgi:hypothetical protein
MSAKDFEGSSVIIVVFYGILTNLLNSGIKTITVLIPIVAAVLLCPNWEMAPVVCTHKLTIVLTVYVGHLLFFRSSAPLRTSSETKNSAELKRS